MAFCKTLSIFTCIVIMLTLGLLQPSQAQNSPQDFLDAHNAARAAVGVGDMEWSDEVAAYAEQYANQRIDDCAMQHSNGQYGENLAEMSDDSLDAAGAVKMWVDEGENYDYDSNTCTTGQDQCLHYTQVVWRDSVQLGCARVVCNTGGTFIICNYNPPGKEPSQKVLT
ncbi:hypothetical protein Cgig2_019495 [Carnegiea gigantea]|uniref:SCP domain-containing protein n=1 Tax=Carnegiea gigantea TaxID=171969 RepID=A0A9Q1KRG9_9CARY|nr:hypothetical protein Cgig2_019495 [Carnegiea gigantea]